ncbi:MAG: hypothetical protein JW850_22775 [Thermoflexales bacterium]|nr:hypothetical protein [Thermoflexales bacterium]
MLNPTDYPEVNTLLEAYLTALQREFGDELLSVYLLGSLSTGAYVPGWSDVNGVSVVRQGEPSQLGTRAQAASLAALSAQPAWRKPPFSCCLPAAALNNTSWQNQPEGWGPAELSNLVEDGVLVWGEEIRDELARPTLEQLRAYVLWKLANLLQAPQLSLPLRMPRGGEWAYYHQHPTAVVDQLIYPTRVLLTWDTGRVGAKSEAVNHYIEEYHGPWEPVLLQADTIRRAGFYEALTPETVAFFAAQVPSLFEWVVKRLLSILLLPDDMSQAASAFRRWLAGQPQFSPAYQGQPYDNLTPGALGKRTRPTGPGEAGELFVPNRKPWLRP